MMKINLCVVLLCIVESSLILANPTPPVGYITTPGVGTYKCHKLKKNWNDARNTCLNEGAHLAVIHSAAEEALIQKCINVAENISADQIWIGVHELFKKDDWISVKDERLDAIGYAHWMNGQPDNDKGNEHCLTITPRGMNDLNCANQLAFVCKL